MSESLIIMSRRRLMVGIAAMGGALVVGRGVRAAEQMYGSQLMTEQERQTYRDRMRRARTDDERARIRAEHHMQMQERARLKGVTLPDQPPAAGGGAGRGAGGGMGGGPGQRGRGGGQGGDGMGGGRGGGPGR